MKGLQETHHRPGEETMGFHHGPQSPLQGDTLFDGNGQMPKVWDLVLQEVQNIRVSSELLPLGRRISDLLKTMERREQGMAGPTLLNSLREFLLCVRERVRHYL